MKSQTLHGEEQREGMRLRTMLRIASRTIGHTTCDILRDARRALQDEAKRDSVPSINVSSSALNRD